MKKLTRAELKFKMDVAGLKQAALCKKLDIPRSTMSQIIAGRMAPTPATRKLQRQVAKELGIRPEQMPGD